MTDFFGVDGPLADRAAADVELAAQALDANVDAATPAIPACKNQRREPTVNAGGAAANCVKSEGEIVIAKRLHFPANPCLNHFVERLSYQQALMRSTLKSRG
jgi:hypothetical protein